MPAKKPADLVVRNETLDEKNQRISRENANKTGRKLPTSAPKELKDFPIAKEAWRRLLREFNSLKAERVDTQDRDLLLDYCMSLQEEDDLLFMRKSAFDDWKNRRDDVETHRKQMKDFGKEQTGQDDWKIMTEELIKLVNKVQAAYKTVLDIDARLDRKRSALLSYQQQMYMTPRSRAGVVAEREEVQNDVDEMEALLGDPVRQFEAMANNGKAGK